METLIKEKVVIAPELLELCQVQEEKQVVVHCSVTGIPNIDSIRVWPTIYIIPSGTDTRSKLLHHFNIVLYPKWQLIGTTGRHYFTLIFEGLPPDCREFDIVEIIPESGAFEARNIARNETDVYQVAFI
jgi:hypothetical protein